MVMCARIVLTSRVISQKIKKAFNITLGDIDEEETPNYIAFVASYDYDDSNQSNVKSAFDNESKRVSYLQYAFNNLMEKISVLKNINLKIVKDVKNLELERDNLALFGKHIPTHFPTFHHTIHFIFSPKKNISNHSLFILYHLLFK
jgi:hypothetical protein